MARMIGVLHKSSTFATEDGDATMEFGPGTEVVVDDGYYKGKAMILTVTREIDGETYIADVPYADLTPRIVK